MLFNLQSADWIGMLANKDSNIQPWTASCSLAFLNRYFPSHVFRPVCVSGNW